MQIFCRVVEAGSFTRAAKVVNLSNAAVSESVKNLEASLGVVLLKRTSRYLHLTEQGRDYYHRSLSILDEVARAESDARSGARALSGVIRVEATIAVGETIIGPLMTEFTRRFPSLSVSLSLINSPRNIVQYGTDVAIRGDRVDNADLWARPLLSTPYVVCASPRIAGRLDKSLEPEALDPALCLGLLMDGQYSPQPWRVARGERKVEIRPEGALASNSTASLIDAAERDAGVIHVLDCLLGDRLDTGRLVRLLPDWQPETRTFYAVAHRGRFIAPKIRALMQFLQERIGGGDEAGLPIPVGRAPDTDTVR